MPTVPTRTLRIQVRRDTSEAWESVNPVLAEGEPGLDIENRILKYGNGSTPWNELPGFSVSGLAGDGSGADLSSVEFGVSDTHLQWRTIGSSTWNNVVELEAIRRPEEPAKPRSYRHEQNSPADTWVIDHNLGFRPAGLYVEDSAGTMHSPSVEHPSINRTILSFVGAMTGFVDLS